MKNIIMFAIIFSINLTFFSNLHAQLPLGTCGIVYSYDAAGNRIKREYILSNGQPGLMASPGNNQENSVQQILQVSAIYPNPTSGKFIVSFTKSLSNATVVIVDASGKVLFVEKQTGFKFTYDISPYAAGTYFLQVRQDKETFSYKIIKQNN